MRRYHLLLIVILLAGCEQRTDLAPVVESKWRQQGHHQSRHIVSRGETLFAVAFRYDTDFRRLAAYNHIRSPYSIRVGQVLNLPHSGYIRSHALPYKSSASRSIARHPSVKTPYKPQSHKVWPVSFKRYGSWMWPAKGHIAANFVPQEGKKGIDIAGRKGEQIRASAKGVVAYAGNGLSGYGNLIIIKHEGQFLTAYGNNLHNRVKEGQFVKAGQVIADMGVIDRKYWGVHFEIRKSGQPVNPMNYLQKG